MWHIGQKVVCVKASKWGHLVVDKIYTIQDIKHCKCATCLHVGISDDRDATECFNCGKTIHIGSKCYTSCEFFIPLDDFYHMEKLVETLAKPELIEI